MLGRISTAGRVLLWTRIPKQAAFSTSSPAYIDVASIYSKLTSFRRKQPKSEVVDPSKASEAKAIDDSLPADGRPRKLVVLGKPRSLEADWPQVRKFAEFKPWPTNHYRKDLAAEEIEEALAGVKDQDLAEIASRFEVIKTVSHRLNVAVPDTVLSSVSSVAALQTHLLSVARPFDERQPDAIYLNAEDFVGTNVTISDPVEARRQQKKRTRELVQQAKRARKQATDDLLAQTRQQAAAP